MPCPEVQRAQDEIIDIKLFTMKKMELNQMENVEGGNDSDCMWAGVEAVATGVVGFFTGGWGLLLYPFALKRVIDACDL